VKILQFIEDPDQLAPLSDAPPDEAFARLVAEYGDAIARTVRAARDRQPRLGAFHLRLGMVFPPNAIVSEQIRQLCWLPYRHSDGRLVEGCRGVLEGWRGCPPRSPAVADTVALLGTAQAMLLLQFDGIRNHLDQQHINRFTSKLGRRLQGLGLTSPGCFGSGPCKMCKDGCAPDRDCPLPEQHTCALESCGFWVGHLCRLAAEHPLDDDPPQPIRWVTDWGLPGQTPDSFKSITGVLIRAQP